MVFNSHKFILFFAPIVLLIYYLSLKIKRKEIPQCVLIVASIVFYISFGIHHAIFILGSLLINANIQKR